MVCEAPAPSPTLVRVPPADAPRDVAQLELIFIIAPHLAERVRRLEFALRQIRAGVPPQDVRRALREQFGVRQQYAWEIVDMALDLAGPV